MIKQKERRYLIFLNGIQPETGVILHYEFYEKKYYKVIVDRNYHWRNNILFSLCAN